MPARKIKIHVPEVEEIPDFPKVSLGEIGLHHYFIMNDAIWVKISKGQIRAFGYEKVKKISSRSKKEVEDLGDTPDWGLLNAIVEIRNK